jgi:hypothetical protein
MTTVVKTSKRPIEEKEVKVLLLDSENFRLDEAEAKNASQEILLQILERDFDLNMIAESMIDNGYFQEEPLSVISTTGGEYIVIEGNRRLATLKFLTQPEYREISTQKKYWEDAASRAKYDLQKVPVIIYEKRKELTSFLGFRHVAGILRWSPLMRARFIHHLVQERGSKADFSELAKETGSRTNTIRDNYITYRLFIQAKEAFDIDTSELEKDFSVFYRALSDRAIINFIGLNKALSVGKLKNPIPPGKAKELEFLIGFIHGTKTVKPVINDSRQLSKLGEILENKEALKYLIKYRNFDQAYALSGGEARRLLENLESAIFYMKESLRDVFQYKTDAKVREVFSKLWSVAQEIKKSFPEIGGGGEDRQ